MYFNGTKVYSLIKGDVDEFKKLLNGSMTAFVNPDGNTTLAAYKFYNSTNLVSADLTGLTTLGDDAFWGCTNLTSVTMPSSITAIPSSCFYGCSKLNNININYITTFKTTCFYNVNTGTNDSTLEYNSNNVVTVETNAFNNCNIKKFIAREAYLNSQAFNYSKIKEFKAKLLTAGSYAFAGSTIEKVDLLNSSIELPYQFLQSATKVKEINLSNCNFTSVNPSGYQFDSIGLSRDNLNDTLELDLKNSSFTSIHQRFVSNTTNVKVILPSTVTTINSGHGFAYSNNLKLILNSAPNLGNINVFTDTNNLKIFAPFSSVDTLKAKTNWANYSDKISCWISADDVIDNYNGMLPTETLTNQTELLWFDDTDLNNVVSTPVSGETYYSLMGPVYLSINELNCSVVVQDGNIIYQDGDSIPLGTTVTITITKDEGDLAFNEALINGQTIVNDITTTYTFTHYVKGNVNISVSFLAEFVAGYFQLPYIVGQDNAYIETNVTMKASEKPSIEMELMTLFSSPYGSGLYQTDWALNAFMMEQGIDSSGLYFRNHASQSVSNKYMNPYLNIRYTLNCSYNGSYTVVANGTTVIDSSSSAMTNNGGYTLSLFRCSYNRTYYRGRIYKCVVRHDDTVIRNYLPCMRQSDNTVGLYDTVNGVFYPSAGTGSFTYE